MKLRSLKLLIAGIIVLGSLSSCMYQAPPEDHISKVPRTNNPTEFGKDTTRVPMPSVTY